MTARIESLRRHAWIVLGGLLLVSLIPALLTYSGKMWSAGHYQYFPVVFIAIGLLFWSRRIELQSASGKPRLTVSVVLLSITGLICIASNVGLSGFGGVMALMFLGTTAVYTAFGWPGFKLAFPVLFLILFAVPLPLNLDQNLIVEMQFMASTLASWILDGAGMIHFQEGVLLITERSQFLTEEACSGIRSLFSSLAVVATASVALNHAWYRIFINLLQTIAWVLVGNAVRVALVVFLADNVSTRFASGIGHELLGIGVFAFILAMVASSDVLITFLLRWELGVGRVQEEELEDLDVGYDEGDEEDGARPQAARSRSENAQEIESHPPFTFPRFPFGEKAFLGILAICMGVFLVSARASIYHGLSFQQAGLLSIPRLPASSEEDLPNELAGFILIKFEKIHREHSYLQAEDSYTWTYQKGDLSAIVSVDCPWDKWHNLNFCYRGLGWRSDARFFLPNPGVMDRDSITYKHTHSELMLNRRSSQRGVVMFSAVDRNGMDVRAGEFRTLGFDLRSVPQRLIRKISLMFGASPSKDQEEFDLTALQMPATTIQVYSELARDFTTEEIASLRQLFIESRELLLLSARWQLARNSEP